MTKALDDLALVAFGPLSTVEMKRRFMVEFCGFKIGTRDPRLNTDFPGKFMAVEAHDESELPTRDGSNGPWCVVGDDLPALIDKAWDSWAAEYAEYAEANADD